MRGRAPLATCFLAALTLFVLVGLEINQRGFISTAGLDRWAEATTMIDTPESVAQMVLRSFPYVPTLAMLLVRICLGSLPTWTPTVLNAAAAAVLITVLYRRMLAANCSPVRRLVLTALFALHPFVLWTATSGDFRGFQLLAFTIFSWAMVKVGEAGDVKALMALAAACPILLFCDAGSIYLLIAMLPIIPFVLPRRVATQGLVGGYIVVFLPLMLSIVSCLYVGWSVMRDPFSLLSAASATRASIPVGGSTWQNLHNTTAGISLIVILAMSWLCFPMNWKEIFKPDERRRAAMLAALLPVIAALLAQLEGSLTHPVAMLYLIVAPWAFLIADRPGTRAAIPVALLGILTSWLALAYAPSQEIRNWANAFRGHQLSAASKDLEAVGHWMTQHPGTMMVDDGNLGMALLVRGHAQGLVIPDSDRFRLETRSSIPAVDYIAVGTVEGFDRVRARFPDIYERGLSGFGLVFVQGEWRIFKRHHLTSP